MTIEERVRRVLTEAVANEPPPRAAPLAAVRRRRQRRPVLVGAAALLLALAAVVSLVAVRSAQRPLPSTGPTAGWKVYTDTARNLQLRYPPDWVLRERQPGWVRIAPPEQAAGVLQASPPFAVGVRGPDGGYYLGEQTGVDFTRGRLPSGQAYVVSQTEPRRKLYSIDWGRCAAGAQPGCGTQVVLAGVMATSAALWDRFGPVGDLIANTIAPIRPLTPSSGDRGRPACRPSQWRLSHPGGWSYRDGAQRYLLVGGFQFLGGPPCHLALSLRLDIEKPAGRRLPLEGNPSRTTVEGDLPEDADSSTANVSVEQGSPLTWYWVWQEWCNKGLPQATLRVTAETGLPGPRAALQHPALAVSRRRARAPRWSRPGPGRSA